ncbi:MAG: hypothetical protein WCJ30_19570 [Deltaproteobacteria bacterium]
MPDAPNARRASGLAITPLAALAVGFFLPTLRACGEMRRPVKHLIEHPSTLGWLVPPYLASAILAVVTGVLLARELAPGRRSMALAWTAVALSFVGASATLVGWLAEAHASLKLVSWSTAAVCVALVIAQRALRVAGWSRWVRLLAAHAALTAGNTVWIMIATAMSDGAWSAVGPGGHLFMWSTVGLAGLGAYGVRGQPSVATS